MSLRMESAIISCNNMRNLAIKEREINHSKFVNQMSNPSFCTDPRNDYEYIKELELLKGFEQNKKTCIIRPKDNISSLTNETLLSNKLLFSNEKQIFNIQTKIK